ncbi:hypothetical protein C8R44DRAFT_881230 [Mycena epipterygia]|nr:hypothetical protein C8R44DRAFT_881230 [Mycena epipterygia]
MCPFPYRIHRFPRLPPATTISGAAPFSRTPNYHLHHPRARRSRSLFFIAGAALFFCPRTTTIDTSPLRLPRLPPTQEHPHTPDALPAHTGSQTRGATGMRSARRRPRLKHQEAIVEHPRRPSAGQLLARPPCGISHRLSSPSSVLASLERGARHPPPLPAALTVAGDRLQHHHTARDTPRDYEPAARLVRLYRLHRSTPVPAALFSTPRNMYRVRSTRHGRSSSPAPPSSPSHTPPPSTVLTARRTRLGASSTRYRRRRPQHLRQPLSTAHAAFVASPRVLAIFAVPTLRSKPAPGTHHEHDAHHQRRAEPAAVVPRRARHARYLPMRCDRLQRRPTVCSKPGPVAQREYDVHHSQRTQHTLQLFPITHATFVPSPRAPSSPAPPASQRAPRTSPTVCAVAIASDHHADPFRCPTVRHLRLLYAASARAAATLCAGIKIPLCSLSERAAAPAALRERLPTASARGREGGRVTCCGIAGEVLVPTHLTYILPFFVYHSFMYFM